MSYLIKTKDGNPVEIRGQQLLGSDHVDAKIKDFSDKERSFLAVASVESPDRVGDVISVKGWQLENYSKNPVVMPFHFYSTLPVGRTLDVFRKGKRLMFVPQFAPYSDTSRYYEMYRDKYLKGFSVGFIPKKSKKIEVEEEDRPIRWHQPTKYLEQELLEVSVAPIPAHQDALSELRSMVKKGDIYVPPRYLMDKNEPYVENYDEYAHVIVDSEDKFKGLYIAPLTISENGVIEKNYAWVVFGPCKDGNQDLYFNQRFIFPMEENTSEKSLLEWVGKNDKHVDVNTDSKDSPVILSLFDKDIEIDLKPFDPGKYEVKSPVTVELPKVEKIETSKCHDECEIEWDEIEGEDITLEIMEMDADPSVEEKPFPNEHACRLNSPGKYTRFRRNNCAQKSDGKCIDVIYGKKKDGKTEIQSLRYKIKVWTASDARKHCKGREGSFEAAKEMQLDPIKQEQMSELIDKLVDRIVECVETVLVNKITKASEKSCVVMIDSIQQMLIKNKKETKYEEGIDIDGEVIDEHSSKGEFIELEDETDNETRTLDDEDVDFDVDVSDEEFKDMVKSAINSCLGKLE